MCAVETTIDDLDFFEYVGGGSFGSVYRGWWKSKNMEVAIKKHATPDSMQEINILSKLSHRNIIQFYSAVVTAPHFCFVTEYACNGSLYQHLQKNTLEFEQILTWSRQIALGMNYLHNEAPFAVIHRDLKSKNVVLSEDMTAKICDFGCARFLKNTTKMSLAGTFPWMAPEAIQQMAVDEKCDTFSFGVVMWELLTSEVPFKGLEGIQVAWLVVAHGERLTIPSSCPPKFAKLLEDCWLEEPRSRPDFRDILDSLQLMQRDSDLPDETQSFLSHRKEWLAEIETTLSKLKSMKRDLDSRQKNLDERERELEQREKEFQRRVPKPPEDHDVNGWTEDHVAQWLRYISAEENKDLAVYADIFRKNNITGRSLLSLDLKDLSAIGVDSLGHRKELKKAISLLQAHNERLLNFPPLQTDVRGSEAAPPAVVNLTLIFGNHLRTGAMPDQRKWKMYMELDGPSNGLTCVKEVKFSFITGEEISIKQKPYLMDEWRSVDRDTTTVDCVVIYDQAKVKKPRQTKYKHEIDFTEGDRVRVNQFSVALTMKSSHTPLERRQSSTPLLDSGFGNASGASSCSGSATLEAVSSQRFDGLPGIRPRALVWPGKPTDNQQTVERKSPPKSPPLSSSTLSRQGSSSQVCGASLAGSTGALSASLSRQTPAVASGNAWFGNRQLHWPTTAEARNIVARGPTIQPSPRHTPPKVSQGASSRHELGQEGVGRLQSQGEAGRPQMQGASLRRELGQEGVGRQQSQGEAGRPQMQGASSRRGLGQEGVERQQSQGEAGRPQTYANNDGQRVQRGRRSWPGPRGGGQQYRYGNQQYSGNQHRRASGYYHGDNRAHSRPLGDSQTLPTGQVHGRGSAPYRRSVSDVPPSRGRGSGNSSSGPPSRQNSEQPQLRQAADATPQSAKQEPDVGRHGEIDGSRRGRRRQRQVSGTSDSSTSASKR